MIEIVFTESAYGSLKTAQRGEGSVSLRATAPVWMLPTEDCASTAGETQDVQRLAEQTALCAGDATVPLGIQSCDVFCFPLALCVGDLSDGGLGKQRKTVLQKLMSICPSEYLDQQVERTMKKTKAALSSLIERYTQGEPLRIWYSHNPDECCGMVWLMAQLHPLHCKTPVYLVKLPLWAYGNNHTIIFPTGWGEIEPGQWGRFTAFQELARPALISACSMRWQQLQEENAPLRILLNGRMQSVPEDYYDSFIRRELAKQPRQFPMAAVIGNVLGAYQLGIGDAWVAFRIEKMIAAGELEVVQEAPAQGLRYRRILRKSTSQ